MADYCTILDCTDPALSIDQRHVNAGNVFVDSALYSVGIKPDVVILPKPLLTQIAATYAKYQACIEGAIGENSPLIDKAKLLKQSLDLLVGQISKDVLGISTDGSTDSGFGSFEIHRA